MRVHVNPDVSDIAPGSESHYSLAETHTGSGSFTCPLMHVDPGEVGHVSNRVLPSCQPLPAFTKMLLDDTIEPSGLICIPLDTVLNPLWGVSHKVIGLPLHGTKAALQKEQWGIAGVP